jgi:serine/threonine protein kinase
MSQHDQPQTGTMTNSVDPLLADTAAGARTARDASLPEQLGEFRILGLLGRGGMGAVYLAEQQQPQREVALKVLRGAQDDPDALRRFQLEGEALALLDHPNIAHVFATGVDVPSRRQHALSGHGAGARAPLCWPMPRRAPSTSRAACA